MLIGVYLLVPVVIRYRNSVKEDTFFRVTWIFLVAACFSMWTSTHWLNWDIGMSFCYLGYLMAGYQLRKWTKKRKNNKWGIFFIILGIILELLICCIQYAHSIRGIAESAELYSVVGPQNPIVVTASVLILQDFLLLI